MPTNEWLKPFEEYDCERVRRSPSILERFEANWVARGDCWWWTGPTIYNGQSRYPILRRVEGSGIYGGRMRAHRLSYILFKGDLTPDLVVDHLCENKLCVRPEHLEAVSNVVNVERYHGRNVVCVECAAKLRAIVAGCKKREGVLNPLP